jgi:hypothetical protein
MVGGKRDSTSLHLSHRFILHQKDRSEVACFAAYLTSPDAFVLKRIVYNTVTHIQRCICPADVQQETGNCRTMDRLVFYALVRPISEGDQEKKGNRPEPGKPKKQKTETQKPERESNKGKRKGKNPRTEELVSSIMQKSGFLSFTHHSAPLPDCEDFQQY